NLSLISEDVFCHGLRDQIGILLDGTVVPCCLDSEGKIPLGNIFEQSLEEIITSKRARNIYDGFSRRRAVEDLCKRCGYAKRNFK
uniref:SPASM domain-containing protein n=2 Tax=Clostridiaceae TaxID=31979 RepID=UPI0034A1CF04